MSLILKEYYEDKLYKLECEYVELCDKIESEGRIPHKHENNILDILEDEIEDLIIMINLIIGHE